MITDKRVCVHCKKPIDISKEKYSLLGTYMDGKPMDESYFHFNCFVIWYNDKVKEKAENQINSMRDQVTGIIKNPQIAGILDGIGGIDKVMGMFNKDFNKRINDLDKEIKNGGENGREE